MKDADYEAMVQENFQTIDRIICRRGGRSCLNGVGLTDDRSPYNEGGEATLEEARANYLSDGTLGDDGSIVCDPCYVGF